MLFRSKRKKICVVLRKKEVEGGLLFPFADLQFVEDFIGSLIACRCDNIDDSSPLEGL